MEIKEGIKEQKNNNEDKKIVDEKIEKKKDLDLKSKSD